MRKAIRTFVEEIVEHFNGLAWVQVAPEPNAMDKIINEWLVSVAAELVTVSVYEDHNSVRQVGDPDRPAEQRRSRRYIVTYMTENPVVEAMPLEKVANAEAPTVDVELVEGSLRRKAYAMAGIFGVPEGYYMSTEDSEPALAPVFSSGVDWSKYTNLFGNLKHA